MYLSFQGQLPVYKVIGTRQDIKVHNTRGGGSGTMQSQRHLVPALSAQRLHSQETTGGYVWSDECAVMILKKIRATDATPHSVRIRACTCRSRFRSALALERIDSSGAPGMVRHAGEPLRSSPLSHGQQPPPSFLNNKTFSWRQRVPADMTTTTAAAAATPPPAAPSFGTATASPPRVAAAPAATPGAQAQAGATGAAVPPTSTGILGRLGSLRPRPLAEEEEAPQLIHVQVVEVEVEEESDDDIANRGDVDEYSVSDVAGEATDEEFDLIVDDMGDLVEFLPEEEGEDEEGEGAAVDEDGGNGAAAAQGALPAVVEVAQVAEEGGTQEAQEGSG